MYLTGSEYLELDGILKKYEVGLRSYIAEKVCDKYTNYNSFSTVISELKIRFDSSQIGIKPFLFQKYYSKLVALEKDEKLEKLYDALNFTLTCFKMQNHYEDSDVPYLSGILDLMFLLNAPLFSELTTQFGSEFEDFLSLYLKIRNGGSHPASKRILIEEAHQITQFVLISTSVIRSEYFWYVEVESIKKNISEFLHKIKKKTPIFNNLLQINQNHEELLMRETELAHLEKLLITNKRRSSSVVLHGYGGVGKTSLAREFCNRIMKKVLESEIKMDFIIWASSKNEELIFDRVGMIKIREFKPQYQTFEDLVEMMCKILQLDTSSEEQLLNYFENCNQGLIVIDNYENIKGTERAKLEKFISDGCPNNIQFLLTSRQDEDIADKRIEIKGFKEVDIGIQFIEEYCTLNDFSLIYTNDELKEFLSLSCGNTLVITISLDRIFDGIMDLKSSLDNLRPLRNRDVEQIAEFMYKHMFDGIIAENEKSFPYIRKILNIMLLYRDPVDINILFDFTEAKITDLEEILSLFVRKFIVNKVRGMYELNEMATKFISLKLVPDNQHLRDLLNKIQDYRQDKELALKRLEEDTSNNPKLRNIIDDWQPYANSESIIIAQAYKLYDDYSKRLSKIHNNDIAFKNDLLSEVKDAFSKLSNRSGHPYVSFQKARVLKLFLFGLRNAELRKELIQQMKEAYEEAYIVIYTGDYRNIINTASFPALLMLYGIFCLVDYKNNFEAVKYLEMASDFYNNRETEFSENNANTYFFLSQACCNAYLEKGDISYLNKALKCINSAYSYFKNCSDETSKNKVNELSLMSLFIQFMKNDIPKGTVRNQMKQFKQMKGYMSPIIKEINKKLA
ncbi:AAA family ATPase [Paenibacillus durus]|uniref:AAA+ ATPase domain-containing protein n=1 Tax=Paenibacillus durus TaxID=44251 RepID=A0A089HQ55_PAEDU|nr:ATP-binding protein [Paenibacillus durus]AIQ14151.1 hypothetical protein PDUR_21205 [Paenibacillus durus]